MFQSLLPLLSSSSAALEEAGNVLQHIQASYAQVTQTLFSSVLLS